MSGVWSITGLLKLHYMSTCSPTWQLIKTFKFFSGLFLLYTHYWPIFLCLELYSLLVISRDYLKTLFHANNASSSKERNYKDNFSLQEFKIWLDKKDYLGKMFSNWEMSGTWKRTKSVICVVRTWNTFFSKCQYHT